MGKAIAVVLLFIVPLFAQYPGAIATDSDLLVAKNRAQTTLTAGLNASATSFTVATGSKFEPNVLVTIDSEIMKVCSVVGNTVSVGDSSCPNIDGRGLENTVAASHSNGALVSAYITAGYHEALKNEIIAIETALGANLANVAVDNPMPVNRGGTGVQAITGVPIGAGTSAFSGVAASSQLQQLRRKPNVSGTEYEFASTFPIYVPDYAFAAQSPAASLIAGGIGQSITLTPCPLGVAGTDTAHYLRLTGTGAEDVLITGGTCTSGASSGTVTFTPANNHTSGAYTVTTATAGLQEAVNVATANGGVKSVVATGGTYAITSPIAIRAGMRLDCFGTDISLGTGTQHGIVITTTEPVKISGCRITSSTTKTGGAAIQLNGSVTSNRHSVFDRLVIDSQYDGIDFESGLDWVLSNSHIHTNSHYDAIVRSTIDPGAGDAIITNTYMDSATASANVLIESHSGLKITGGKMLNAAVGVDLAVEDGISNTIDLLITGVSLEGHATAGFRGKRKGPSNTGYFGHVTITGNEFSCGAGGAGAAILTSSAGADNKSVQYVNATGNVIQFCTTGISIGTNAALIANNMITLTGVASNKGIVTTNSTNVVVSNNQMNDVVTPYTLASDTLLDGSGSFAYASLPAVADGSRVYCSNCNSTCTAGGSSGRMCFRENGAWTR